MTAAVVDWLARTSVQAGLLALVVLALEWGARGRLAPALRLGLWLIVVLRFALPSPVSVDLPAIPWSGERAAAVEPRSVSLEDAEYIAFVPPPPPSMPSKPSAERASGARPERRDVAATTDVGADHDAELRTESLQPVAAPASRSKPSRAPFALEPTLRTASELSEPAGSAPLRAHVALVALWLVGLVALLVRAASAERDLRRALRVHASAPSAEMQRAVEAAAQTVGLRHAPTTVVFDALDSPAVHGVLRPRLLLPSSIAELDPGELRAVLIHECFHLRRRDLWWTPALFLVRAIWWFHPLAHLAVRHALAALEEVRDDDAVRALETQGSPNSPARLAYARVLVRLAETRSVAHRRPAPGALPMAREGRGLRRRVEMILTTHMFSPRTRLLLRTSGAAVLAAFAWAGLVQANVDRSESTTEQRPNDRSEGVVRDSVVVERQGPPPAERIAIEERLAQRIPEVKFSEADPMDAFRFVSEAFDVNVVVNPEPIYDNGIESIGVNVANVTGAELLDVLVRACDCDLGWTIRGEVVAVGDQHALPRDLDLRFYKVRPILDRAYELGFDEIDLDDLVSITMEYCGAGIDAWDRNGTWLQPWEGMLAIRQSEEVHARVHAFLDRLLILQLEPDRLTEPWRAGLEQKMSSRSAVVIDDMELSEALEFLATTFDAPIRFTGGHPDDWGTLVHLELRDANLGTALEWCLAELPHRITIDSGEIVLRESTSLEVHLHPVGELLNHEGGDESEDRHSYIEEFMRSSIDPESWDMDPLAAIHFFGDLLIVRQSRENQAQVRALLAQIKRALDD